MSGENDPLVGQINEMKEDMREIRSSMSKIADAVTRLAVLESKNEANARRMESLEERVTSSEKELAAMRLKLTEAAGQVNGAVTTLRVLWVVVGAAVVGFLSKLLTK